MGQWKAYHTKCEKSSSTSKFSLFLGTLCGIVLEPGANVMHSMILLPRVAHSFSHSETWILDRVTEENQERVITRISKILDALVPSKAGRNNYIHLTPGVTAKARKARFRKESCERFINKFAEERMMREILASTEMHDLTVHDLSKMS